MNKVLIYEQVKDIVGIQNIKIDEPMKKHTSFKLGGNADILVTPRNVEELKDIMIICKTEKLPYIIMGNGTNLIVRDKGIRGIVIKLFDKFESYSIDGEVIKASAGTLLSKISNIALKHGLSGLEFASGIPGTLGGAVAMNAGAYGGEMKDVVIKTEYMDIDGQIKVVEGNEHQFGYRSSFIQNKELIVLKSYMKLVEIDKQKIKEKMNDLNSRRKNVQPLDMPSAGSVFKRPEGFFAGKLIEDCGLRGFRIGGAEVSNKHCGFIVNTGNATTLDVLNIIRHVQDTVMTNFGVELKTEVKVVGEE